MNTWDGWVAEQWGQLFLSHKINMSESINSQLLKHVREEGEKLSPQPLLKRKFIPLHGDENEADSARDEKDVIRVMQWNILAQGLCLSKDGFAMCPDDALDWNTRKCHILEEMLSYSPNILCLQEVDHFAFLEDHLQKVGFRGVFFPKPDSPCLYTQNNNGPDGCAMFWNAHKFNLVSHCNLVLEAKSGCPTNQVAIICKFEMKGEGSVKRQFYVATTHLKSKTAYLKLRLLQGSFLEDYLRKHCEGLPLIVCGDFNAEPSEDIIHVMKKSKLDLCSSYSLLSQKRDEPPYTTWKVRGTREGTVEICHTIDYLFFTNKHFNCLQLLQFPTFDEMGEGLLPSYTYPSDHLSLVADLQLTHTQ